MAIETPSRSLWRHGNDRQIKLLDYVGPVCLALRLASMLRTWLAKCLCAHRGVILVFISRVSKQRGGIKPKITLPWAAYKRLIDGTIHGGCKKWSYYLTQFDIWLTIQELPSQVRRISISEIAQIEGWSLYWNMTYKVWLHKQNKRIRTNQGSGWIWASCQIRKIGCCASAAMHTGIAT